MPIRSISLDIEEELHKLAKQKALDEEMPVREIYERALKRELDLSLEAPIRPDNRYLHEILERVLAGGERLGIAENLRWADAHMRATRGPRLADPDAERRDKRFGEAIASLEILRAHIPENQRDRDNLDRIIDGIGALSRRVIEQSTKTVDKFKKMK